MQNVKYKNDKFVISILRNININDKIEGVVYDTFKILFPYNPRLPPVTA